jgi:hypothetical protein
MDVNGIAQGLLNTIRLLIQASSACNMKKLLCGLDEPSTFILEFGKQDRESLSTFLPVELKRKVKSIVSQAKGYRLFSLCFVNMGDGSSNRDDSISQLDTGWRKLIFSSGFD